MENHIKNLISLKRLSCDAKFLFYCLIWLCFFMTYSAVGLADIRFKDVTADVGINHAGQSWGASWGDFNADGWPDLWVGNHNSKPTLYLNKQDGTFENIIDQVWSGDSKADTHGAAWADFDNDGDQDLVELVGFTENEDGTACVCCGKNHLYINENGKLWERASDFGLDHKGCGRSPLWCDLDRDGLLDLMVVNTRKSGMPTSTVFLQKNNHFNAANEALRFQDGPWRRREKIWGLFENAMNFTYRPLPSFNTHRHLEFAQLADLLSNGYPELILFSKPTRIYKIDSTPFEEVSNNIGLPDLSRIFDVAVADFNGDQRMDMYVAQGDHKVSDLIRTGPSGIKGKLVRTSKDDSFQAIRFQAEGDIHFQIYPTWRPLSKVYIGKTGRHPTSRSFTLSPKDPDVYGPPASTIPKSGGVSITYDPNSRTWTMQNSLVNQFVDFISKATQNITELKTIGFKPFKEKGIDVLLIQHKDGFVKKALAGEAGEDTSCYYVVAGDFDNDMDMDLYLTCTGPVANLPNRLLENDGKGDFRVVSNAGGAIGSQLGRSDVVACADYDRDGFLDLFVTNGTDPTSPFVADGPHQLFRNLGNDNNWLEIDLEGVVSNRDGIGSRVELAVGSIIQIREQTGGMHRLTQNHQRLHFGLGQNTKVDRITIRWPIGIVQQLNNIEVNQILHITEPPLSTQ